MSIVVNNLTKTYGTQKAVDGISFQLAKGEITGFIGPNGSGKSTTMKSICGILTPDSGNIQINGSDIEDNPIETKRLIGYLPESNPLYYDQYIEEYLKFCGKLYKVPQLNNRLNEIMGLTGLAPERRKKIGQLSKGFKQRVGIAQALIHDPEILILDEPTTGLDPNQLVEIRELIRNISASKTVLLSTHILQEVEAICHKVIMINKGKIVADSQTDRFKNMESSKQTILVEFKEEVPIELINTIAETDAVKKVNNFTWLLESTAEYDIREKVFEFALLNKLSILELQRRQRSLEDTFKELSSDKS